MATDPYTSADFSSIALLTIDVQRDVLDGGAIEIPRTSAVLPRLHALVEAFRRAGPVGPSALRGGEFGRPARNRHQLRPPLIGIEGRAPTRQRSPTPGG